MHFAYSEPVFYVEKRLGLDLSVSDLKKSLEKMGYDYKAEKVEVPCYRADILHQIDIIEDIAIGYGYDNFVPKSLSVSTVGQEDKQENFKTRHACRDQNCN